MWVPRTEEDFAAVWARAAEVAGRPVDRRWVLFCVLLAKGRRSLRNDVPGAWSASGSALSILAEGELAAEDRLARAEQALKGVDTTGGEDDKG